MEKQVPAEQASRELREATRFASQGKYKCRACGRVAPQQMGVVVAFLGNVLLAICPDCIKAPIIIEQDAGRIRISMPQRQERRIILASELPSSGGIVAARPVPQKVKVV